MFWLCPRLKDFLAVVFKILSEAFDLDMQPSAEIAIFGVPGDGIAIVNKRKGAFAYATLLAILLKWKAVHPPKASV